MEEFKLARNLEAQNSNLNKIIRDEKQRVSDLRIKLNELNEQIQDERKSNREMRIQHEHMRAGFLAATAENEGYARDMAAIRKELDAIKIIWTLAFDSQKLKKQKNEEFKDIDEGENSECEELKEKLHISDKMVHAKYLENETLQTDLDKTSERVVELETKVTVMNENITKVNEKIQIREREVMELTELLKDTQTALESEKLAKDEYIIKCELLERKLALLDVEGNDERDGIDEEMEREILDLREKLDEERAKVAMITAQDQELRHVLNCAEFELNKCKIEHDEKDAQFNEDMERLKIELLTEKRKNNEKSSVIDELSFQIRKQGKTSDEEGNFFRLKDENDHLKDLVQQLQRSINKKNVRMDKVIDKCVEFMLLRDEKEEENKKF